MLAATLVGGGPLLASQAGASAVLVATLQPPEGFDFDRALDALVGSGTALAVGSLLLPVDPVRLVREGLGPVLDRLAAALHAIADALEHRDAREAERALTAVDRVDALYDHLTATLAAAGDAARISLGRRGTLNRLERYVAAVGEVGLAIENVRALARGAVRAIALDDSTPPEVTGGDPRAGHRRARARKPARGRGQREAIPRGGPARRAAGERRAGGDHRTSRPSTSSARSASWRWTCCERAGCRAPRHRRLCAARPRRGSASPRRAGSRCRPRSPRPPSGPSAACPRSPSSSTASA